MPYGNSDLLRSAILTTSVLLVATLCLIYGIASAAKRVREAPLSVFHRMLIPAPAVLLVFFNFLSCLSSRLYAAAHPGADLSRDPAHQAFPSDWLFPLGLGAIALLPFSLSNYSRRSFRLIPAVWGAYFLWLFPYVLLLLGSGVPFQD